MRNPLEIYDYEVSKWGVYRDDLSDECQSNAPYLALYAFVVLQKMAYDMGPGALDYMMSVAAGAIARSILPQEGGWVEAIENELNGNTDD